MKSRITRMTAALLAAVLSLGLLVGCKPKKELTRYSTIFYDVFDTVTQVSFLPTRYCSEVAKCMGYRPRAPARMEA